jgi:HEAT repeat protein
LVWDLSQILSAPPPGQLTKAEVATLCEVLIGADTAAACRALVKLVKAREETTPDGSVTQEAVKYLFGTGDPSAQVAKLLTELDDEDYAVRQTASEKLTKMGRPVARDLRWALLRNTGMPAETRLRVEVVLLALTGEKLTPLERAHGRGLAVLARRSAPLARETLEKLAREGPDERVREAAARVLTVRGRHFPIAVRGEGK